MQGSCKEKKRPGQRSYSERASGCGCHNTIPPMVTVQEGEVALLGALLPGQWSYPHGHCYPNHKNRLFCPILMCIYVYICVCTQYINGIIFQYIPHQNNASSSKAPVVAGPGPLPSAIEVPPPQRSRSANETRLSGQKSNENDPKRRPKMIRKDPKWT